MSSRLGTRFTFAHTGFTGVGGFFLAKLLGSVRRRCSPWACRLSWTTSTKPALRTAGPLASQLIRGTFNPVQPCDVRSPRGTSGWGP